MKRTPRQRGSRAARAAPVQSTTQPAARGSARAGGGARARRLDRLPVVFLLSFSGLLLQVAITRLTSAALNYHLTFLIVGAALLGTGAGGTWAALRAPAQMDGAAERRWLSWLTLGVAAATALLGGLFSWVPFVLMGSGGLLASLVLGYPLLALPYALQGAAISLALRQSGEKAHGVYAAALAGAAAGCIAAIPVMDAAGPRWAVSAAALASVFAAMRLGRSGRSVPWLAATLLVSLLSPVIHPYGPNVLSTKPLASFLDPINYPDSELLMTRWDATSRVDVFESPGARLLWHTPTRLQEPLPELRGITIDADALTTAARSDSGEAGTLARRLPTSVPFAIAPRERVLVIGPGGGLDVEAALAFGARRVDAVEVNRGVAALMLGPMTGFTNNLYRRQGVRLVVDDGRSFLRQAAARGERYDAIVLTAVDSWAALTSGAYSLTESYLYTAEAFQEYLDRLNEGGVLAISRWYTQPPREMHRLAELARMAATRRGGDPVRDVMLLRAGQFGTFGTLMVRKGAFPAVEVTQAQTFARDSGYGLVYEPGNPTGEFAPILAGLEPGAAGARVPTDDRPYFFDHLPWLNVLTGRGEWPLPQGHAVLLVALIQSLALAVAAIVLPLRRVRAGLRRPGPATLYFGAVGLAFSLAEMALLQRASFLLGLPALSFAVVVGGMLAGAALGSWRLGRDERHTVPAMLAGVAALWVFALAWGAISRGAGAWALEARVALLLAIALALAALVGGAVPIGLRRLMAAQRAAAPAMAGAMVPWAWGINGAAAVIGAGLSVLIGMELGIGSVLIVSGLCYAAALLALRRLPEVAP